MRRAKYLAQAGEKAKELMSPEDYATMKKAIEEHKPVIFKYTRADGFYGQYRKEYVDSFFEIPPSEMYAGSVNVWSLHRLHRKNETYRVEKIKDVKIIISLIEAVIDPSRHFVFWDGSMTAIETTPLQ